MTKREQIRADIKRRLNSYKAIDAERGQILEELRRLDLAMSSPSGPNLDGMPRSPGAGNPVARMVAAYVDLEAKYKAQVERLADAQLDIELMIETLDPVERRIARYRYLDGLTWEEVCDKMCYSWRQTHRIHGRMLDRLTDRAEAAQD